MLVITLLLAIALLAAIGALVAVRRTERSLPGAAAEHEAPPAGQLRLSPDDRQRMIDVMNEAYVAINSKGEVIDWNAAAVRIFGYSREEAIGSQAKALFIPPEDHDEFDWLIARGTGSEGETKPVDLRLDRHAVDKAGRHFMVELAAATLSIDGEVSLHSFMHDISERQAAREELEAHAADVEALAEATRSLAHSRSPEDARRNICSAVARAANADVAVLFEPDGSGRGLRAAASQGASVAGELLPFDGSASGAVRAFESGEPVFVADLQEQAWEAEHLVHGAQSASALWVPVEDARRTIGIIVAAWADPVEAIPTRLERVMSMIAAEAAAALERASLLERLGRMAITDDLTGLPNRRAWNQELERELARAQRSGATLSIAMVDLDFFKAFNDENGHQAGDRLLKEAASTWKSALRGTDLLARYGGEEFTVALPACEADAAENLIERLRGATPGGESCSAGLVTWNRTETADELVGRADRALYQAKVAGRNRTVRS